MNTKKYESKFDFELMNSLGHLKDEEFKVAYYILNTIGMSKDKHPKIYRAVLADLCDKSERTISRITDRLNELGIIKKDVVSDGKSKYNYYSNPRQKTGQNLGTDDTSSTQKRVTDDTFNKSNNNYKNNKIQKTDNSEKKQSKQKAPYEESLADYRRRMKMELPEDEENDDAEEIHLFEAPARYDDGLPF